MGLRGCREERGTRGIRMRFEGRRGGGRAWGVGGWVEGCGGWGMSKEMRILRGGWRGAEVVRS